MMWLSIGFITAAVVVFMYEFPAMRKAKQYKEITVFTVLLFVGTLLNVLRFAGIALPSPMDALVFLFHPIVKGLFQLLS